MVMITKKDVELMNSDEKFELLKLYYNKHNQPSIRFQKGTFKNVQEGLTTPFSEITKGSVVKDNNMTFVPMFRDYWSGKCFTYDEISLSDFNWVWNRVSDRVLADM